MKKIISLCLCLFSFCAIAQDQSNEDRGDFSKSFLLKLGVSYIDSTGDRSPFNAVTSFSESAFNGPLSVQLGYRLNEFFLFGLKANMNKWKDSKGVIDGSSTGTAEYRRWVASVGTRDLISAPVTGEGFNNFYARNAAEIQSGTQGGDLLFGYYDNNNAIGTYYESSATDTYTLDVGRGYRTATSTGATLSFKGDVNTGNIPVPITKGTGRYAFAGLIGNPYTTHIDANALITAMASAGAFNSSYVAIYGYDGDVNDDGSSWYALNSLNSSGINIAPGQGFMVYSDNDGGSITFTKEMQMAVNGVDDFISGRSGNSKQEPRTEERYNFKLKIENNSNTNKFLTDLYFLESNGSRGLDVSWDAGAFQLPGFSIATQLVEDSDGTAFQIQCLSTSDLSSDDLIIPVYVKADANNKYTIGMEASTLPIWTDVYLQDTELNAVIPLEDAYTFTPSEALNGAGRFYLTTSARALNEEEVMISSINVISLLNTGQIKINGLNGAAELSLFDLSGRKVMYHELEEPNNQEYLDVKHIRLGIYVVELKLKHSDHIITKKILIE